MTFSDFWHSLPAREKEQLAKDAGTSYAYLSQLASGFRRAGLDSIVALTRADKRITQEMLRPDLFGEDAM